MLQDMLSFPACLLCYLYFLQGLPYGLQARFLPIYFRTHGMSLTNIGFIKALFFPWLCKTLWAPFVDRHGNKKIWLTWSMLGLAVTCVMAACIEPNWLLPLSVILLVFNLLTSTQDIATDGLAIEILTTSQVASGNIAQVVGYKFGAIVGGGLLAWLSDHISWGAIFVSLSLVYIIAIGVIRLCVPEGKIYTFDVLKLDSGHHMKSVDCFEPEHVSMKPSGDALADKSINSRTDLTPLVNAATDTVNSTGGIIHKGVNTQHASRNTSSSSRNLTSEDSDMLTPQQKSPSDHSSFGPVAVSNASDTSGTKEDDSFVWWIKDHFADVLRTEGTVWILVYVLVYKLGEQGALNMMPMFLIDGGVAAADVGLWTGVVGQVVSIAGSVAGGAVISSGRHTALSFLWQLSIVKVAVLAAETCLIILLAGSAGSLGSGTTPCVVLMLALLLVSGAVSTAAFTLMMLCSQRANAHCQASHYSLLATVEVMGKLVFSVFVGAIADAVGYPWAFALFLTLSVTVLPLFSHIPDALVHNSVSTTEKSINKNH